MNERRRDGGRLVVGLFLMLLGALLLANQFDLLHIGRVWDYWPLLLMGLGVVKIARPDDGDGRWGGGWLLMVGLYCGISEWRWFGLDWHNSWPLMVIAAGTMMVVKAIGGPRRARPRGDELTKHGAGTGDAAGAPDASGRTS